MSRLIPTNRFFQVFRKIPEFELRPGPTVTFISEVDLSEVDQLRQEAKAQKPSYTAFVVRALALALREFPYANQRISRRVWLPLARAKLQMFDHCDIAVAAERDIPAVESAAFVDIIRDANEKSLSEITIWLSDLSRSDTQTNEQWRQFSGIIKGFPLWLALLLVRLPYFVPDLWDRYRGAAALVTSPAKYGVDTVAACWSWPVGVSFGLVKDRPLVKDGEIKACPTFNLTCNFDRRIMAGAQAGRFFAAIVKNLEAARSMLAEPPSAYPPGRPDH
jgi:pyruvate/2-oxoglutarate dehydrogenase complex dihydrolipoamide acyltransferase (E2) component